MLTRSVPRLRRGPSGSRPLPAITVTAEQSWGAQAPPPPPLAAVHLLRVGQALHSCPNLASLRHSGLLTLLLPTRARLVNDYTEGSGLRSTLLRAKHPSGKASRTSWPGSGFPRPVSLGANRPPPLATYL